MDPIILIKGFSVALTAMALWLSPSREVALGVTYPYGAYTMLEAYDPLLYGGVKVASYSPNLELRGALKLGPCYLGASSEGRAFLECRILLTQGE